MLKNYMLMGLILSLCTQNLYSSDIESDDETSNLSFRESISNNSDNEDNNSGVNPLILNMLVNTFINKDNDQKLSNNLDKNINNSDKFEENKALLTLWQLPSKQVLNEDIEDDYFKEKTNIHKNLANKQLNELNIDLAIETHCYNFFKYLKKGMDEKNLKKMTVLINLNKPILKKEILKHAIKVEENKGD